MEFGPVDVVMLAMGEPKFDGSVLTELAAAADKGIIRVLDAMVLIKGEDDVAYGLDLEDMDDDAKAALGFVETGTHGLFDAEDAATMSEGLVPGSTIVALAIEHTWAIPLVKSLYDSGAELGLSLRIPAPVVNERYAELAAGNE
jgi:hypothetical protein